VVEGVDAVGARAVAEGQLHLNEKMEVQKHRANNNKKEEKDKDGSRKRRDASEEDSRCIGVGCRHVRS
jgi:hypothetical protein